MTLQRLIVRGATAAGCLLIVLPLPGVSLKSTDDLQLPVSPSAVAWSHMRVPKWSNGAVVDVQNDNSSNPLIWVLDRQGQRNVSFTIADAKSIAIYDWDRGLEGMIALSGSAVDREGRASSFIAWISPDGTISQIVQTSSYRPRGLAFAPDGTIWTYGTELMTGSASVLNPDAGIFRHFDKTGKMLGQFVPQSTVRNSVDFGRGWLRVSADRIAFYAATGKYVELSLNGAVLMDASLPLPGGQSKNLVGGLALAGKGQVFISAQSANPTAEQQGNGPKGIGVYVLDRAARAWKPLLWRPSGASAPNDFGHIFGADGDSLILNGHPNLKAYRVED